MHRSAIEALESLERSEPSEPGPSPPRQCAFASAAQLLNLHPSEHLDSQLRAPCTTKLIRERSEKRCKCKKDASVAVVHCRWLHPVSAVLCLSVQVTRSVGSYDRFRQPFVHQSQDRSNEACRLLFCQLCKFSLRFGQCDNLRARSSDRSDTVASMRESRSRNYRPRCAHPLAGLQPKQCSASANSAKYGERQRITGGLLSCGH